MRRPLLAAVALAAATGCASPQGPLAPGHVTDFPYREDPPLRLGEPAGPSQEVDPFAARPTISWAEDGAYLAVTAYGSSSCPNGPTDITVTGDQQLEIDLGELYPERDVCTADLGPTVTVVEVPEGITPDEPVTAVIGDEEPVVLGPAVTGG